MHALTLRAICPYIDRGRHIRSFKLDNRHYDTVIKKTTMWSVGVLVAVTAGKALEGPGPCSVDGIWNALGSGDGAGRLVNLSQVCW